MPVLDQAFVTLATNDTYCQGALVLGQSLRTQRATRKLVVLITSQVSSLLRVILSKVFDEVIEVNLMDSADYIHLAFLKRPELGVTLTKLHCWTLTHYSKCVFLDADTLVLSNIDELFDRVEFSAAPDPGWPDCFNSGVFVFQPSLETHGLLLRHAVDHGSFDGADQGLLNSFFSSWSTADIHKHLPFIYNLSSNTAYTYSPAFKRFGSSAKVVHFLGPTKPWNYKYNPQTGSVLEDGSGLGTQHQTSFLNLWWTVYQHSVLPLYESFRDAGEHVAPGHATGVGEPCAESAGSSQPWPAEGPSEETVVTEDIPPSPKGCRSEDTIGWPELETSAGVRCDPLSPPSPQCADSTETQTTSRPADQAESGPCVEAVEPSQEPPVDVTGDPSPQDALEFTDPSGALLFFCMASVGTNAEGAIVSKEADKSRKFWGLTWPSPFSRFPSKRRSRPRVLRRKGDTGRRDASITWGRMRLPASRRSWTGFCSNLTGCVAPCVVIDGAVAWSRCVDISFRPFRGNRCSTMCLCLGLTSLSASKK